MLSKKIDFAVILTVNAANPNGDPLNGNRPRVDYNGYGEITDVCLKRKLRDRLQENGHSIFVQSDEKKIDGMSSLRARAESEEFGLGKEAFEVSKKKSKNNEEDFENFKRDDTAIRACEKWFDVRAFGQLFAFSGGISIPIRGPVSLQSAFSVEPIVITSSQITKSVNGEGDGAKKESDTMGMKHRVDSGVYVFYGSMNPQLSEKTGFSDTDAKVIKEILPKLFENDASSARPEGSMEVKSVIWWEHNSKSGQYSSAKVHRSLKVHPDGTYDLEKLDGLKTEEISGF